MVINEEVLGELSSAHTLEKAAGSNPLETDQLKLRREAKRVTGNGIPFLEQRKEKMWWFSVSGNRAL